MSTVLRALSLLFSRFRALFPRICVRCVVMCRDIRQNNEKFVPSPQHSSPLALSMLRFVGRLMGLSLRTRLCLPFQLPGLIWKRMLVSHWGLQQCSCFQEFPDSFEK